jgi:hypothetical protein
MENNTYLPITEREVEELHTLGMELAAGVSPYLMRLYGERLVQIGDIIMLREADTGDDTTVGAEIPPTLGGTPPDNLGSVAIIDGNAVFQE